MWDWIPTYLDIIQISFFIYIYIYTPTQYLLVQKGGTDHKSTVGDLVHNIFRPDWSNTKTQGLKVIVINTLREALGYPYALKDIAKMKEYLRFEGKLVLAAQLIFTSLSVPPQTPIDIVQWRKLKYAWQLGERTTRALPNCTRATHQTLSKCTKKPEHSTKSVVRPLSSNSR